MVVQVFSWQRFKIIAKTHSFRQLEVSFSLQNVLKGCLKWMRNQGSEIGIGLKDQYSLHVELRNHFDAWTLPAAGMSDQQFKSWAQDQIVEIEKDGRTKV